MKPLVIPLASKPSIPLKKAKPVYSGIGNDNPGPAGYNPEKP